MHRHIRWSFAILLAALFLAACSRGREEDSPDASESESTSLNFYNWEDYILPELITEFEKSTGIKVNLHTYKDEDDILAALQSGLSGVDLVVVSDNIVLELQQAKLLHELDPARIPNLVNAKAHPYFFAPHGDDVVAVPYMLGTGGIIVNTEHVPDDANSWDVLWNPAYKGRIAMLDNSMDVINAGFKSMGYSINTEDPTQIEAMRDKLLAQRPLLAGYYDPVTMISKMASGELWAAQLYNGDAMTAVESNPALRYFVPVEGASIWVDCLVVPRDAPHPDAAQRFINYLHDPSVMARNAEFLWYQPVNLPAIDLLPAEIRNAPEVFPTREVLSRCEHVEPISPESMRERLSAWAELQAAK